MGWAQQLDNRRGSRPRCVLLADGERGEVAVRLTRLVNLPEVVVSAEDIWQPHGRPVLRNCSWDTSPSDEAVLSRQNDLVSPDVSRQLRSWWLAVTRGNPMTPSWDLGATCTVGDEKGLLLVEAKAYARELKAAGKEAPGSRNGGKNHERIGAAIAEANEGLRLVNGRPWALSRDSHYQLPNRFAWAWKLASLGIPVVLVYLGFLNAVEMTDRGRPSSWTTATASSTGGPGANGST